MGATGRPAAKVRLAVAGAGLIGLRHIEEIQRSRGAELAAIVDVAPKAADTAREAGVPLYASLGQLFAQGRPDGVILATPNQMHVDQGLECIAAGVPVLIEKPVAHTLAEGVRLCDASERAGAKVLVGHHRRHSPILHKAVEIVRSGVLGPLVGVMGSAVFYKPDAEGYYDGANAWRRRPGGGPILLNMIHEVGNLRAMVGEIVAVQAFASNAIRGFEVEDTVAINLRFANGALGTFLLSDTAACPKSWEQTSQENKAYASYDEDAYTIVGTRGSLGVPTMRLALYERDADRSWFKPFTTRTEPLARADPLANQIEHFAAVIRGEAQPLVTCRDGLANLRVTDAIVEAARTGHAVATA
ncbi:MAG: Gfo/Idh/MocA family oxidoreductase [Burkholderiales bacterium]|nr:Gfo/Idh/MocA family oxidoreductase [Burkholderiales bacterium]